MEGSEPTGWWDVKEGDIVAELHSPWTAIVRFVSPGGKWPYVVIEWEPMPVNSSRPPIHSGREQFAWSYFFKKFDSIQRVDDAS